MKDKGLLIVSFGTTYQDALERDILPAEQAIADAFPDWQVKRAFGSGMVIRRLKERDGKEIANTAQALQEFVDTGVRRVVIQPTFLIHGVEFDRLMETVRRFTGYFDVISVGRPLLNAPEDYITLANAIAALHPASEGPLVLMGHGTEHYANAAYPALETVFRKCGYSHVYIGAVEGYPDIHQICTQLQQDGIRSVTMMPLMLVAGDHARNDMASDEPDSWQSILSAAGIASRSILTGLGSYPFVQTLFADHARQAAKRV